MRNVPASMRAILSLSWRSVGWAVGVGVVVGVGVGVGVGDGNRVGDDVGVRLTASVGARSGPTAVVVATTACAGLGSAVAGGTAAGSGDGATAGGMTGSADVTVGGA